MKLARLSKLPLAVFLLLAPVALLAQNALDPEQLGPYPVGVTTIQLDDHSRVDPETGGPR